MHPDNIGALVAAKIAYAGLANNHTLDFNEPGLFETVKALKRASIHFAGAGETREEATQPAVLQLPSSGTETQHKIQVWSAADHPQDVSHHRLRRPVHLRQVLMTLTVTFSGLQFQRFISSTIL